MYYVNSVVFNSGKSKNHFHSKVPSTTTRAPPEAGGGGAGGVLERVYHQVICNVDSGVFNSWEIKNVVYQLCYISFVITTY